MAANRIEVLKSLLEQKPADTFARYALAQELMKSGELEEAAAHLLEIQRMNPDYVAAYFHAGQALEKLGRIEEARQSYQKGIEVTTRSGDSHTRSELQAALDLLP